MTTEEVLEDRMELIYPIKPAPKSKIRKFFSNETVQLILFSLGASAIMITLFIIAGIVGVKIPTSGWWY
ncbi:MAG: hypothetical protein ACFFDH_19680 [Promethearchaeota archaeon]